METAAGQSHPNFERARFLMDRGRYAMAADELRLALRDEPESATVLAYLAVCMAEDPAQLDEAFPVALGATARDPLQPVAWFAVSRVQWKRGDLASAEQAARIALGINPESPQILAQVAGVVMDQGRHAEALEVLEHALAIDPGHRAALSLRAGALTSLGRHDEAARALEEALAHDPEHAPTHSMRGRAQLRAGDAAAAVESFRQALRLDPTSEPDRRGLMEALRSRNLAYRLLLRASLRVQGASPSLKWGLIGVGLSLVLYISVWADDLGVPELAVLPLQAAIVGAVLLSWTGTAVFDLFLFFDPLGRASLTRVERAGAVAMTAVLAVALALAVAGLAAGGGIAAWAAVVAALYTVPIAATLRAKEGRARWGMLAYTLAAAVLPVLFLVEQAGDRGGASALFGFTVGAFFFSDMVSDWLSGRL